MKKQMFTKLIGILFFSILPVYSLGSDTGVYFRNYTRWSMQLFCLRPLSSKERVVSNAIKTAIDAGQVELSRGQDITNQSIPRSLQRIQRLILAGNEEAMGLVSTLGNNAIWVTQKTPIGFTNSVVSWPIHGAKGNYGVMMSRTIQAGVVNIKGTGKTKAIDSLGGDSVVVIGQNSLPGPNSLSNLVWFGETLSIADREITSGLRWQEFSLATFGKPLSSVSVPIQVIEVKEIRDGSKMVPIRDYLLAVENRIRGLYFDDPHEGTTPYTVDDYKRVLAWGIATTAHFEKSYDSDFIADKVRELIKRNSLEALVDRFLSEVKIVQIRSICPLAPRISMLENLRYDNPMYQIHHTEYLPVAGRPPFSDRDFLFQKRTIDRIYREICRVYGEEFVALPDNEEEFVAEIYKRSGLPHYVNIRYTLFSDSLPYLAQALYALNKEVFDRILIKAAENNAQNLGILFGVGGYAAESFCRRNLIAGSIARDFDNSELPSSSETTFDEEAFEKETAESLIYIEYALAYLHSFLTGDSTSLRASVRMPTFLNNQFDIALRKTIERVHKTIIDNPNQSLLTHEYVDAYKIWRTKAKKSMLKGQWHRKIWCELERDTHMPGGNRFQLADVLGRYPGIVAISQNEIAEPRSRKIQKVNIMLENI